MCLGIILTLTCFANFPALQPEFEALWGITKTESGLILGIFSGGVLVGTPILSPLADKIDPRRIWLASTALMALSSFGFAFFANGSGSENSKRPAGRPDPGTGHCSLHGELHHRNLRLFCHDR
jgi:MFS family permease